MVIRTPHGSYNISSANDFIRFIQDNQDWPELNRYLEAFASGRLGGNSRKIYEEYLRQSEAFNEAVETGDYASYQQQVGQQGWSLTPEQTESLTNQVNQQRTEEARTYDTQMRDTSLLSSANQLNQLGLSPSNVIQVGGASSNGVAPANVSNRNHSAQLALARYQQKMSMARSMIGMVSSMANAGIYGAALNSAKRASSVLASAGAHSGLKALASSTKAHPISAKASQDWDNSFAELDKLYPPMF